MARHAHSGLHHKFVDLCNLSVNQKNDLQTHGEFNWDSQTQGLLLSSFYYGFMVLQIPGGLIAERYGGKRVFLVSIFLASLISCLNPMIARMGSNYLVASRAIQGLVEAPVFPCLYAMGSQWLPLTEKSFLMSIILAGELFRFTTSRTQLDEFGIFRNNNRCLLQHDCERYAGEQPRLGVGLLCAGHARVQLVSHLDFPLLRLARISPQNL